MMRLHDCYNVPNSASEKQMAPLHRNYNLYTTRDFDEDQKLPSQESILCETSC